jgi:hypothetical protein
MGETQVARAFRRSKQRVHTRGRKARHPQFQTPSTRCKGLDGETQDAKHAFRSLKHDVRPHLQGRKAGTHSFRRLEQDAVRGPIAATQNTRMPDV